MKKEERGSLIIAVLLMHCVITDIQVYFFYKTTTLNHDVDVAITKLINEYTTTTTTTV